ncbi:MAG: YdcF family protein, partial [Bryobacteraceae bacterium]
MEASRRNEAGRFEPLDLGENRSTIARVRNTAWSKYPYSVIVVPGSGSESVQVNLSAAGRLRLALAARRFREGKAPFLLLSGGYVHPNQTPFSEAVEMKKALITDFGIPSNAILIDPHARHTTTNMRNAARQMYRYGMPFEKKALVTTDEYQSAYIEAPGFADRCMKELGYLPYKILSRVSKHDLEFLPLIESLHLDATDPLDP